MGGKNTGFFETNDGGLTWIGISVGSNLNRIFILSDTRAFASGTTIYEFTDEALSAQGFEESFRKELEINFTANPVDATLELIPNWPQNVAYKALNALAILNY